VITNPVGADVLIDGKKIGVTPTSISDRRDMSLTLHLPGYRDKVLPLRKGAWPAEVNVNLEPESIAQQPTKPVAPSEKSIQITSTPPGASIEMDGKVVGQTPGEVKLADQTAHQLVLKLEGHQDATQTVSQSTPDKLNIELQAVLSPGFVKYSGSQRVAVLNGSTVLKGNPIELDPGSYKLSFRSGKGAYIHFSKNVDIKSGETTVVRGPEMGTITIKAVPSNCKISINGEFIDIVPIMNLPIQEGNHTITFSWDTLGKKETKSVTIEAGQSQTVTGVPEKNS